jgi:hypothetical protein
MSVPLRGWPRRGRHLVAAASALLFALVWVAGAEASAPIQVRMTQPVVFSDTDTCGFQIDVNLQADVVGQIFLDAQGNPDHATFEQGVVGTDTAKGVTLRDAVHYVDHFDSLGGDRQVGLTFHVQGAGGGVVLRDAGYIAINPDGSTAFVHGPHPFLAGDTAAFCAAFG